MRSPSIYPLSGWQAIGSRRRPVQNIRLGFLLSIYEAPQGVEEARQKSVRSFWNLTP
jgi:hypothetical protein